MLLFFIQTFFFNRLDELYSITQENWKNKIQVKNHSRWLFGVDNQIGMQVKDREGGKGRASHLNPTNYWNYANSRATYIWKYIPVCMSYSMNVSHFVCIQFYVFPIPYVFSSIYKNTRLFIIVFIDKYDLSLWIYNYQLILTIALGLVLSVYDEV